MTLIFLIQGLCAPSTLSAEQIYQVCLPAQSVAQALTELSAQTDIQVLFPYDIARDKMANPVEGEYTLQQVLELLLRGSGLTGGLSNKGVLMISEEKSTPSIKFEVRQE